MSARINTSESCRVSCADKVMCQSVHDVHTLSALCVSRVWNLSKITALKGLHNALWINYASIFTWTVCPHGTFTTQSIVFIQIQLGQLVYDGMLWLFYWFLSGKSFIWANNFVFTSDTVSRLCAVYWYTPLLGGGCQPLVSTLSQTTDMRIAQGISLAYLQED